jgi:hypothetical protein
MSDEARTYYAYDGRKLIASGSQEEVIAVLWAAGPPARRVLVFDGSTGKLADLGAPLTAEEREHRGRGRPKLGVEAREVTLLPRHWEWLAKQPGGASAALRRLVETARADASGEGARLAARHAADAFMTAMGGNEAGYEEALRALYRGDAARFKAETEGWPKDIREPARTIAAPAFEAKKRKR